MATMACLALESAPSCAAKAMVWRVRLPARIAPRVPELRDHEQAEERQHIERYGRALTKASTLHAGLIGQRGEQVGRVGRPAAGPHLDDLEIGERLNDRKKHDDGQHR